MTVETAPARNPIPWNMIALALALVAIAAAGWASMQYQRANQLAASLDTAKTQIDQLQGQVTQLQQQAAQNAAQLQGQVAQLQQQAAQSAVQLQQEAKPDLPVTISFRRALLGSGMVATFKNVGASPLEVAAIFVSQATGQQQRRNLVLPPNIIQEIGPAQGWPFAPGQRVLLSNANFRPKEAVVPTM